MPPPIQLIQPIKFAQHVHFYITIAACVI